MKTIKNKGKCPIHHLQAIRMSDFKTVIIKVIDDLEHRVELEIQEKGEPQRGLLEIKEKYIELLNEAEQKAH